MDDMLTGAEPLERFAANMIWTCVDCDWVGEFHELDSNELRCPLCGSGAAYVYTGWVGDDEDDDYV